MTDMAIVKCLEDACQRVVVGDASMLALFPWCPFCGCTIETRLVELRRIEEGE